jgi:ribosomal protein L40E
MARTCLFCGAASPLDAAGCRHCHEAFAGAEQRKQQRAEAAKQHQYMQLANTGIQAAGVVIASGAAGGLLDSVGDLLGSVFDSVGD